MTHVLKKKKHELGWRCQESHTSANREKTAEGTPEIYFISTGKISSTRKGFIPVPESTENLRITHF